MYHHYFDPTLEGFGIDYCLVGDEVLDGGFAPPFITGDAWYASKENLARVRSKELEACFGIEKDRLGSIEKGNLSKFVKWREPKKET